MQSPISTYRIQFHKEFTFSQFKNIIPYLENLGVKTIYASPIFKAVPGSMHGYDGTNPNELNAEIGTKEQLFEISEALKNAGFQWLQDIVPNHMAFEQNNVWLMDVLEKGAMSEFAIYFDTVHTSHLFSGKLMLPFLGSPLHEVIGNNEIEIRYDGERMVVQYFETTFPLHPRSYITLFQKHLNPLPVALQPILQQIHELHPIEEPHLFTGMWQEIQLQWKALMKLPELQSLLHSVIQTVNTNNEIVTAILDEQEYRLCHWKEASRKINYRRFFTINGLICMNMNDEKVFDHYHKLTLSLVKDDIIQGLRIDHIDGLYDPTKYLEQLRKATGSETYITVEKILESHEELPANWQVQGNTGYDFLTIVNDLFTFKPSEKDLNRFYNKLADNDTSIQVQQSQKKAIILFEKMGGELENLTRYFIELDLADKKVWEVVDFETLKDAIAQWLLHMPVYRYYGSHFPLPDTEKEALSNIFNTIRRQQKHLSKALDAIENALFIPVKKEIERHEQNVISFYLRFMQFAGPLMAKGIEDTLMYTYNRFIAHNEVGGSLENFGITVEDFHNRMQQRQLDWPLSINATSTHDTKRGEDVRARLNVLSEMSDEWIAQVKHWQKLQKNVSKNNQPDANDSYLIYQTIIGMHPMPGQPDYDVINRLHEYIPKALREAKEHSNWSTPDEAYENVCKQFITGLLEPDSAFYKSFKPLHQIVCDNGIVNSLSQLMIKTTCPGVPDMYQGCELWDLTLVDPDNRRPVDYTLRKQWLDEIGQQEDKEKLLTVLWNERYNGKIKLWLTNLLLKTRNENIEVFTKGDYISLQVKGKYKQHIVAFARKHKRTWIVTIAPLNTAILCKKQKKEIQDIDWKDTTVLLPDDVPTAFVNQLDTAWGTQNGTIEIKQIFDKLPFAILMASEGNHSRKAGILLPIKSLPSPFGIGDMGPEAKAFADYLYQAKQSYWQILPLNPTGAGQQYSPYSALSTMAGNPLFISPELLEEDGLLQPVELKKYMVTSGDKINYKAAEKAKTKLLDKAYQNFASTAHTKTKEAFQSFIEIEKLWLHDFALFMVIRQKHKSKPWDKWPTNLRDREKNAIANFDLKYKEEIEKEKWIQFIFFRQWHSLKEYCNSLGIEFFGDLPFYVSYDSADVWANRALFALDETGNMEHVAGVPPDYFNSDGQLWGMPIFNWTKLKETGYAWWIQRIKKNFELFDLLRLDHFRAFAAYWQVPASEITAKHGQWIQGPGNDLFDALKNEFGDLPFVAEDLGDIDEPVYKLRNDYDMAGMKVLQFAFGSDMAHSPHIPHNYTENFIAYSGTHDNNTTKGWYRKEIDKDTRLRLQEYAGQTVSEKNVSQAMADLLYKSAAKTVILTMQDILGLDEKARTNVPASLKNNWSWRLKKNQLLPLQIKQLREMVEQYNRI